MLKLQTTGGAMVRLDNASPEELELALAGEPEHVQRQMRFQRELYLSITKHYGNTMGGLNPELIPELINGLVTQVTSVCVQAVGGHPIGVAELAEAVSSQIKGSAEMLLQVHNEEHVLMGEAAGNA